MFKQYHIGASKCEQTHVHRLFCCVHTCTGSGREHSASTGNILSSPLSSRPRVASDASESSIQPRNKHGGSYDYGVVERLEEGDNSHNVVGATVLRSDDGQRELQQPSTAFPKSYSHNARNTRPIATSRQRAGSSEKTKSYSLSSLPTPPVPLLPLPHSVQREQGRELERSTRSQQHKRQRNFLSQDAVGDTEMPHIYSSGPGHTSTHYVLSLQDEMSSHRGGPLAQPRGAEGAEAEMRTSHEEMLPILEAADHIAARTHHSPPQLHSRESDTAESPQLQPLQQVLKPQLQPTLDQESGGTQERYYPVFFSPASGRLFMQAEGHYHILPDQFTNNPIIQSALVHTQPQVNIHTFLHCMHSVASLVPRLSL